MKIDCDRKSSVHALLHIKTSNVDKFGLNVGEFALTKFCLKLYIEMEEKGPITLKRYM